MFLYNHTDRSFNVQINVGVIFLKFCRVISKRLGVDINIVKIKFISYKINISYSKKVNTKMLIKNVMIIVTCVFKKCLFTCNAE